MKTEDIKEYETGRHCFGEILRVNGKDYEEMSKAEVMEFIQHMCETKNNINADILIREMFREALSHLQFEGVEYHSDSCDQCGDWNDYAKYVPDAEEYEKSKNANV